MEGLIISGFDNKLFVCHSMTTPNYVTSYIAITYFEDDSIDKLSYGKFAVSSAHAKCVTSMMDSSNLYFATT